MAPTRNVTVTISLRQATRTTDAVPDHVLSALKEMLGP